MRVATYNINDVRKRIAPLRAWLDVTFPDVVCLQEIKCTALDFPFKAVRGMGYEALVYGQKTWNGVANTREGRIQADRDPTWSSECSSGQGGSLPGGDGRRSGYRMPLHAERKSAARAEVRSKA